MTPQRADHFHQVPPNCDVFYGSSLWTHFNINLIDYFTPEEIQTRLGYERPYTREMNDADAAVEVRWSVVYYNQGMTRLYEEKANGLEDPLVAACGGRPSAKERVAIRLSHLKRFESFWPEVCDP